MNNYSKYYCFECKFTKSLKGILYCRVYRCPLQVNDKACLDFELKENFIKRKPRVKKKNEKI